MTTEEMEAKLFQLSERECYHRDHPNHLSDYYQQLEKLTINGRQVYLFDNLMEEQENFTLVKQSRFSPVPYHNHSFIELNYIYSGTCTQLIDDQKVTLTKGQICLIDTGIPHSIEMTGEKDVLINLLIKRDYFAQLISREQFNEGVVLDFVLTALSDKHAHDQYIVFKNNKDDRIHAVIQEMMKETYEKAIGSKRIISNLIAILFTFLVREFDYQTNKQEAAKKQHILAILTYIEENFQTVTLPKLATLFNYSPSYLSALIKRETSKNLTELIIEKKLNLAHNLIASSTKPITKCAAEAGFTNITFFYKKYKIYYGHTPKKKK